MIRFNSRSERYSELSNFHRSPFILDGEFWISVEHYYQAHKFLPHNPEWAARIRAASGPGTARKMGRSDDHHMRADWDDMRDVVMAAALRAKFSQNHDCLQILLETGDEHLVEHTPWGDDYWGDSGDGTGMNRLGQMLMEIRAEHTRADAG